MNAAQNAAFQANGGLSPSVTSSVLVAIVFATFLLWAPGRFVPLIRVGLNTG